MKKILSLFMTLVILCGMIPASAFASEEVSKTGLEGKSISILGDSISTYSGISNDASVNSTLNGGAIYYTPGRLGVYQADTWWQQTMDRLGMTLMVNNSWSGSCILNTRSGTVGAYVDRCVQLHNADEEEPDIIAVYLGTNDFCNYKDTLGTAEAIVYENLITENNGVYTYAQPSTAAEAYAIILHKAKVRYPDAELYCFTLLAQQNLSAANQGLMEQFNNSIQKIAEHFGAYTVDLYNDSGIHADKNFQFYVADNALHPGPAGMDAITGCFISALLKNSRYVSGNVYDVDYDLTDVIVDQGLASAVFESDGFECSFTTPMDTQLEVMVTMDGRDITESCYSDKKITIENVTGDIQIIAEAKPVAQSPESFRWETKDDVLVSITANGNAENALIMTHGSITNGTYSKTRFTLSKGISLRHDLPWCVEWKSSGTWTDTTDGALLFSEANTSTAADTCYFYRRHNNDFFALGTHTGGKYHNYGVKFAGTGIDTTAEHVFSLENRIAQDGSNMVYLLVDGKEVGPLNHHYIGGTDQKETVDWVNGKDFYFSYMGTTPHTIGGCSIEYIQVWESGRPETARELDSYRWELSNNTMQSIGTNGNEVNVLTLENGSVANGAFNKVRYSLQNKVELYHDVPWAMEWRSTGNWSGMLFGSVAQSPSDGLVYLFRDTGTRLFAFGEYNGSWNNYGLITNYDMTVSHDFRLENRIAEDGSNAVYLLIDGQEAGAMNQYYIIGQNQNTTVNWANGKDIIFSSIGTTSHPVSGMQLEYLQVWESGHTHDYQASIKLPTCTEDGYTTYNCSCGGSYMADHTEAAGHKYENSICTVCGVAAPHPYVGKSIACIGDSITAGVGVTKDVNDYVTLLAKSMEMDYIRLGASGSTLCTDGHAVCNVVKLTEENLAGADVVTILMGINDFVQARKGYYTLGDVDSTDTSTIYGALHMWCQRIRELQRKDSMKDTEFYFMTPLITSWNNSVSSVRDWDQSKTNYYGYTLRDLCNAIIEVCAIYNIPVIDLNLVSGLYYNSAEDNTIAEFGGDGAHPGAVGHQMMADAIEDILLQNALKEDHDHAYGSWITTIYPGCEDGEQQRVCSVCRAVERRCAQGSGHDYQDHTCIRCGNKETSTFEILDTRCGQLEIFTYEIGMTWREWLNSKFNTGMGSCIAIWVGGGPNLLGMNPHMDIFVNGNPADYDEVISEQDALELVKYQ